MKEINEINPNFQEALIHIIKEYILDIAKTQKIRTLDEAYPYIKRKIDETGIDVNKLRQEFWAKLNGELGKVIFSKK